MLQRIAHPLGLVTYQSPLLTALGVKHAFSTRAGGVSSGPYHSLNLASPTPEPKTDAPDALTENFTRFCAAVGFTDHRRVAFRQVHGAEVLVPACSPASIDSSPDADAVVSAQPDLLLTIRVADCVPILLASDDGRVVAAVHAGWRGLIAGVLAATVRTLQQRFSLHPQSLRAAIGPCLSTAHFEVGPEVAAQFAQAGLNQVIHTAHTPKPHVDLALATFLQLQQLGILPPNVDRTDRCTFRDSQEFFSHRRDHGCTGRMLAAITPAPGS
ncbi:MAG: peptidoglycan editing factor PgeF [Phycisphaeraceae bacterium]|nr:peptidoglycan editing factor PgeF [Phycisphaeraceae bacterium]